MYRFMGCFEMQVIFRKRATNSKALLRKMTCKDRASYGSSPPAMGWLRSVGALELQVSFAKEPYKRDYILQKRPMIFRSLLIEASAYWGQYLTHINEPRRSEARHTCQQVTSTLGVRHTHHTCQWVTSTLGVRHTHHVSMSHVHSRCARISTSPANCSALWNKLWTKRAPKSSSSLRPRKMLVCRVYVSIVTGHFPKKSLTISGSLADNDLHFKASYKYVHICCVYVRGRAEKGWGGSISMCAIWHTACR